VTTATGQEPGRRVSRAVLFTGVTLGTALLVTAYWDGWRPRIPALPSVLGVLAGAVTTWLLFAALATVAAELLRRHHKALARHTARGAGRGTLAAARTAGKGSRSLGGWLAARAARRWEARDEPPPLFVARRQSRPAAHGGEGSDGGAAERAARRQAEVQQRLATGQPAAVVTPATGTNDPASVSAPARPLRKDDRPMTTSAGPAPAPQPGGGMGWASPEATARRRQAASRGTASRGNTPAEWKSLVTVTADFEPGDDGELLEWMASEVAGMTAYAEALTEVYETCVNSLGVDPAAMNAVHDTADAAADAATAMAYARQKFAAHYAEVREFAASGGLLPYDGRWIKGEGDA
jgi:hypothetical protein